MKSAVSANPGQGQTAMRDLSSLIIKAERVLKAALVQMRATGGKRTKVSGAGAIEDMVGEIERLKVDIKNMTVVLVPHQDQYVMDALKAILPKLPTLIENKREELLDQDIERFVESVMPSDPLKDVLLEVENDNVALREKFVKSNRCLDSKSVATNAGYTSGNFAQTAWRWKSKRQIFAVDYFGKDLYPAFQFREGKPLPVIKKILAVIGKEMSSWQIAFWFVAENSWLDGQRPIDLMVRAQDEVLEAATRTIERAQY